MEKEPQNILTVPRKSVLQPVINTVKIAFRPVTKTPCVSHSVNGKKSERGPDLKSENNGFYMGKIIRKTTAERIRKTMQWKTAPDPIYTEEFIAGALEYLFAHLKPGEKARIVVCRALSEIFNGPKDVKHAISTEEEIELIYRIAAKKFGKGRDRIEVIDLEKQLQHGELFEVLRQSADPDTGEFEADRAFGVKNDITFSAPPSSLEIARCLYGASLKNEKFAMRLKKGIPAKLKETGAEDLPTSYYSIAEIAIRLAELFRGRYIHGGSNRQAIYDEVIEALIKGEKGSFKKVRALHPLFKLLEGKRFETLHLDNINNPYRQRGEKRRALSRLAAAGIVGLAAVTAPYGIHRYQEMREREAREEVVKAYINDQLKNVSYYVDGKFRVQMDAEKIEELVKRLHRELEHRYHIPVEAQEELRIRELFRQFLIQDERLLKSACTEEKDFAYAMDLFIRKNKILLEGYGLKIGRPYEHLAPYMDYILEAAEKDTPDISVNVKREPCSFFSTSVDCGPRGDFTELGIYYGHELYPKGYQLYLVKKEGRQYLVARDFYDDEWLKKYPEIEDKIADTKKAAEAARSFVKTMKFFDIMHLMDWEPLFYNLHKNSSYSVDHVDDSIEDEEEPCEYILEGSRTYEDYFGAFGPFELIENNYYNQRYNSWERCLKARIPGQDANFTIQRAHEAAVHFREALKAEFY